MEKAERVAVVPVSMGWSDLGSWDALHAISACDDDGNACKGDVVAIDTENCLIRADGVRVARSGSSDLIVVANGNDVLIMPRGRSQEVKKLIEAMKTRNSVARRQRLARRDDPDAVDLIGDRAGQRRRLQKNVEPGRVELPGGERRDVRLHPAPDRTRFARCIEIASGTGRQAVTARQAICSITGKSRYAS